MQLAFGSRKPIRGTCRATIPWRRFRVLACRTQGRRRQARDEQDRHEPPLPEHLCQPLSPARQRNARQHGGNTPPVSIAIARRYCLIFIIREFPSSQLRQNPTTLFSRAFMVKPKISLQCSKMIINTTTCHSETVSHFTCRYKRSLSYHIKYSLSYSHHVFLCSFLYS